MNLATALSVGAGEGHEVEAIQLSIVDAEI
jgi:hypothetical protein